MRWPWVSRLAFDMACTERDRLREQNDQLTESLIRMERFKAGMAETPRPAKRATEPMPRELFEYYKGWKNPSIRKDMIDRAIRRHSRGEAWPSIKASVMPKPKEEGEDADGA